MTPFQVSAQDFDKGNDAYDCGDYKTAFLRKQRLHLRRNALYAPHFRV